MKIALALYPINDLGGIINHVENLAFGLRELGHQVSLCILYWQESFKNPPSDDTVMENNPGRGWYNGAFCAVNQQTGWNAIPGIHKFSYKGKDNLSKTKDHLSGFDLIIWEIPVPTKIASHAKNSDWLELYDACSKNVAIVHDGNLKGTPWIYEIKDKLTGVACVHECAYNTATFLDVPRSMILNPQDLSSVERIYDYKDRQPGFLSLQVFKGWKHVDDIIRAVPYMHRHMRKVVAGGGIEQRYMVSVEKVKPKYYCHKKYDSEYPEALENRHMIRIWDRAVYEYGMEYWGWITNSQRDSLLRRLRTLIDPSYSLKYKKHGSHFNRVIVDAMKMGAIPIGINFGMSDNEKGIGPIFKPNINYLMIKHDDGPKIYADLVNYYNHMNPSEADYMINQNYDLLKHFDRRKIAQDFVDLAMEKRCGYFNKRIKGKENSSIRQKSDEGMGFFRGKKEKVFVVKKKKPASTLKVIKEKKSAGGMVLINNQRTIVPVIFKDLLLGMKKHGPLRVKKTIVSVELEELGMLLCGITEKTNANVAEVWLNRSIVGNKKFVPSSKTMRIMCAERENTVTVRVEPKQIEKALKIIFEFKEWKMSKEWKIK